MTRDKDSNAPQGSEAAAAVGSCIRQRPFGIAGDWHGLPRRVSARHRGACCMGNCMGLIL